VGLSDAVGVLGAAGTHHFDGRFLAARDLTRDQAIDAADVALVVANWGARADSGESDSRRESWVAGGWGAARKIGPAGLSSPAAGLGRFERRARELRAGPADAGPVLSIEPALTSVTAGDVVTVEVRVADVSALYGAEVRLAYDPVVLAVQDVDPATSGMQIAFGELLPAAQRTSLVIAVDEARGEVHLAAALTGEVSGIDGGGVLARLVFRALAPGGSDVRVVGAELRDDAYPTSNLIAVSVNNGQIDVRPVPTEGPPAVPTPEPTLTPTAAAAEPTNVPGSSATPAATLTTSATEPASVASATPLEPRAFEVWLPWAARP
jgi:hypothetical protein